MTVSHYPIEAFWHRPPGKKMIKLPSSLVLNVQKYGPATRWYELIGDKNSTGTSSPVQEVLQAPNAIFEHIREHQPGGLCYCGIPTCGYTQGGVKIPPSPKCVYCVFVNAADVFFECGWEPADPDDPTLPLGYQSRFKEKLWPRP